MTPSRVRMGLLLALSGLVAACGGDPTSPGGDDDPPAPPVPLVGVGAGGGHSCAIDANGRVLCWGSNTAGQLGTGTSGAGPVPRAGPVAQGSDVFASLSLGDEHTCTLSPTREIWCWGSDEYRQLGYLSGDSIETCGAVPCYPFPRSVIDGSRFGTFTTGARFTCVGSSLGTLYCWGDNRVGQGGAGGLSTKIEYAWPVSTKDLFRKVAAGDSHTCAIGMDGITRCWGLDDHGQLGVTEVCPQFDGLCPAPMEIAGGALFVGLALGGTHSCGWTQDGTAQCWGGGEDGQLGDGGTTDRGVATSVSTAIRFVHLTAGGSHTCGLTAAGQAYCWGSNERGQVGIGTAGGPVTTPAAVIGDLEFADLAAGAAHTCGATTDGQVYCWGANDRGQVGDGTTEDRPGPVLLTRTAG